MGKFRFRPLKLKDQSVVANILMEADTMSCQMCFANLWCLHEKYETEYCVVDSVLYIRQKKRISKGCVAYFPPIGKQLSQRIYDTIWEEANESGHRPYLFGVTCEKERMWLPKNIHLEENVDWSEYLYLNEKMKTYSGSAMALKRRDARVFWRLYGDSAEMETIGEENIEEIQKFQNLWMYRNCEHKEEIQQLIWENKAIHLALKHFRALELQGLLIRIDGRMAGYSYGTWLGNRTFDICVQKADYHYRNINQAMIQALAIHCCPNAKYLNFEEDIGIAGLRNMKMSYKPDKILKKYNGFWQEGRYE